ncbi:MAG: GNAT family N-acetyltransferase [Opitutales bacterium]
MTHSPRSPLASPPTSEAFRYLPADQESGTVERWGREFDPMPETLTRRPSHADAVVEWVVRALAEDAVVASVTLHHHAADRVLGCSLWVAPPFRARGHGRAIGRELLDWAFAAGVRRVETAHYAEDLTAGRLAERLGLLPEGVQRGALLDAQGTARDLAHWGLLASDR